MPCFDRNDRQVRGAFNETVFFSCSSGGRGSAFTTTARKTNGEQRTTNNKKEGLNWSVVFGVKKGVRIDADGVVAETSAVVDKCVKLFIRVHDRVCETSSG